MKDNPRTFHFTCTLSGVTEFTDAMTDALYETGCDDAGVGSCDGVVTIDFDREADSLGDAIGSAVKAVESAGYKVAGVAVESAARPHSRLRPELREAAQASWKHNREAYEYLAESERKDREYKGFRGVMEFDAETGVIRGKVVDIQDMITFQGKTVAEAEKEFRASVDDYLDFHRLIDERDAAESKAVLAEGDFIPWEQVKKDLHLE